MKRVGIGHGLQGAHMLRGGQMYVYQDTHWHVVGSVKDFECWKLPWGTCEDRHDGEPCDTECIEAQ